MLRMHDLIGCLDFKVGLYFSLPEMLGSLNFTPTWPSKHA